MWILGDIGTTFLLEPGLLPLADLFSSSRCMFQDVSQGRKNINFFNGNYILLQAYEKLYFICIGNKVNWYYKMWPWKRFTLLLTKYTFNFFYTEMSENLKNKAVQLFFFFFKKQSTNKSCLKSVSNNFNSAKWV